MERTRKIPVWLAIFGVALASATMQAATIVWNAASGVDTNWSDSANWLGGVAPGGSDDVKFFDTGAGSVGVVSNVVDSSFAGFIGTLQYGETNGVHTTLIASGVTLSVTNGNLSAGTPTDPGVARNLTNTITGAGATLYVTNPAANISINQTGANGPNRANLDLSGLDNFIVSANRIGIGDGQFPGVAVNNKAGGNLILARTNLITLAYTDTLADYLLAGKSSAITMSRNSGNNPAIISLLQLGINNVFNVDSMNFGMDKSANNSTPAHGILRFNPAFAGQNLVANFYGAGGPGTRVTWWSIGDGNQSASSSNGGGGTNDFSLGTVNAFVNTMSLARDASSSSDTWAGPHKGVFIFTNGTVDVNTLTIGNQYLESGTATTASLGQFDVGGPGAVLKVNSLLTLGTATLTTVAGTRTSGNLNITNGTVYANTIAVGANSVTNAINLVNGTLVVTNTIATNAAGLFNFTISNSTLGLTVPANGTLIGLVNTLNTVGPTNLIQLDPNPVIFPVYPTNISLIRYTTWAGSNVFGLANVPTWAPNATIVSNGPNLTVDLSLPTDPRPVITQEPLNYSGMPGDNVTTNFAVALASAGPVTYYWYYFTNGATSTNLLADGPGPSGLSTIVNSGTANMSLMNAQEADSGNYFVVASNTYGTATSTIAVLLISSTCIPPTITGPNNETVIQGNNATFTATVSADPVAYLQWQRGGVDIPGANGSSVTVTNAQYPADDQAVISLIATNACGAQTNSAVLTVTVPPVITNQPVSLVVTNTQSASFTIVAGGAPAPTYQWYKNSIANPIANATNATFTIANAAPSDMATYFVKVVNSAGSITSTNVTLTVNSTMSAVAMSPANGQSGVCYDTPLYLTLDQAPSIGGTGKIRIFNVTNSSTPVDTLDLSQGALQNRTIGGETFASYPIIITGNTAAIYPHAGVMTSNQTYYVLIDDGVLTDSTGALFAGISATNAWQFTTKPGGPANSTNLVVAQDYSGDFTTVQGAIDSVPANNTTPTLININNGVYTEIVNVHSKNDILFRGQSRSGVVVGYANNSTLNASTHFRMAVKVNANDIAFDDLTISNSTAQDFSQAEALMVESGAQRIIVNNCNVDSTQDTILGNISTSKAYFNNSLVQGDVDFIWGGGNFFFTNCEIRYLIRAGNGAALGPNPSPGTGDINSNGFAFVNSSFTTLPGANPADTIGRTRGITNGNTALINCFVSTNIGGWASDAVPTNLFRNWYYNCTNDLGAAVTLSNGIALASTDSRVALASNATQWLYGWTPSLAPNITSQPVNQTVNANQPASFTVAATGIPGPTYQWVMDGTNVLTDQTNATLTIANASGFDIGSYAAVVSNGSGSVTSSVVTLSVIPPTTGPTLVTPTVQANGNVQFTISGVPGSAGFSYRVWATTNLTLTPVTNTWTLLTNDVFGTSPTTFIDATATATGAAQRFYVITVP